MYYITCNKLKPSDKKCCCKSAPLNWHWQLAPEKNNKNALFTCTVKMNLLSLLFPSSVNLNHVVFTWINKCKEKKDKTLFSHLLNDRYNDFIQI